MKKLKKLLKVLGPGFITGASDDDPSGIGTYSQTGAQFGYSQLWLSPFSTPFMIAIQEMCGRIGLVTGTGLSGVIRTHYSKYLLYFSVTLLLIANTVNIGADLGAMAASVQLLLPVPYTILLLFITFITLFLEIFISYKVYVKYLKYLTLTLFAYIFTAFIVRQDWRSITISTLLPSFSFSVSYLMNVVAVLGTSISPYLFFWQASEEVEEEVAEGKIKEMGDPVMRITRTEIRNLRVDTVVGMVFSQLVMWFIIVTTASTLHINGLTNIETAPQAALALRPLAGNAAFLLFTIGIIGTGLLGVPVLAGSASYALSEAFGLKEGLYKKFTQAHGFYGIISLATILGLAVNFIGLQPFTLLYYTAILNGLIAPPLMIIILLVANNRQIMKSHTNSRLSNFLGVLITLIMSACALALIFSLLW